MLLFGGFQIFARAHNPDVFDGPQREQVFVACNDQSGSCFMRALDEMIVVGIAADTVDRARDLHVNGATPNACYRLRSLILRVVEFAAERGADFDFNSVRDG